MSRLIIREATAADYDDIVAFYRENPDEHVMLRDEQAVRQAITNGTFFLAIDTEAFNSGRICAASAVYDVQSTLDTGGSILLKEAGGSLVKQSMRGLGLHKVFHAARGLHEYILDRHGFELYFGAIILPNEASVRNIRAMGFEPWENPPHKLVEERSVYAIGEEGIGYFRLRPTALQAHAKHLLAVQNRGIVEGKDASGGVVQFEIILSIETLKRYRPIIEQIALGEYDHLS